MRAVLKQSPGPGVAVGEVPSPDPGLGAALLNVIAVGLCGTDIGIHTWQASYHWLEPHLPLVLGHEVIARVAASPADSGWQRGERVVVTPWRPCGACSWCRRGQWGQCPQFKQTFLGVYRPGAMAEQLRVPPETCHRVPDALPDAVAVLAEPMGVAGHAVEKAGLQVGDRVVIYGPGPIGLLATLLAVQAGAEVVVAGITADASRLAQAARLGAATVDVQSPEGPARLERMAGPAGFDAAFDFAGATAAVLEAVERLRPGGTLVLTGTHSQPCPVPLARVVRKGLRIFGSYGTWDWGHILSTLARHQAVLTGMVTHEFALAEAPAAFDLAARRQGIKVVVRP